MKRTRDPLAGVFPRIRGDSSSAAYFVGALDPYYNFGLFIPRQCDLHLVGSERLRNAGLLAVLLQLPQCCFYGGLVSDQVRVGNVPNRAAKEGSARRIAPKPCSESRSLKDFFDASSTSTSKSPVVTDSGNSSATNARYVS